VVIPFDSAAVITSEDPAEDIGAHPSA
jgi:hypothetical protein